MSVLGLSMPLASRQGANGTGHGLLASVLADPLQFGDPTFGPTLALDKGVRTIPSGPPSPLHRSQGYKNLNSIAGPSSLPSSNLVSPSSTVRQSLPTTPTRKGKEPASELASTSSTRPPLTASPTNRNADGSLGKYLHPAVVDLSWPQSLERLKRPGAGLINPSMACYANSTLQVVLHTPPVLKMIIAHARETQDDSCLQAKKGFCSLCTLYDMVRRHWQTDRYSPKDMHSHLGHIKKGFSRNKQEDAHEFFRFLTDSLQATALAGQPKNLSEKLKHTTWVHRIWGGLIRSRVLCGSCKKPSDTYDHFLDLSLDVNRGGGAPKLHSMLQAFTREERLEGDNKYKCEACKSKANAIKFFKIDRAPPVLTFHLKRFNVSYGFRGQTHTNKYNSFISFPEHIDMSPYMVEGHHGEDTYRLFAVTCHRGTEARFGHYTSYVKAPSGKWYHADDEDMTPCSIQTVLQDRNAYLLSYIKVTPDSMPQWNPSESPSRKVNGHSTPGSSTLPNGTHRNGDSSRAKVNGYSSERTARPSGTPGGSRKRSRSPDSMDLPHRPAKRDLPMNGHRPMIIPRSLPPPPPSDDPPSLPSDPPEGAPKEEPEQYGTSIFTWQKKEQKEKSSLFSNGWRGAEMLGMDRSGGKGYGKGHKFKKRVKGAPTPFNAQNMGRSRF